MKGRSSGDSGSSSSGSNKKAKTETGDVRRIGRFTVSVERALKVLIVAADDAIREECKATLTHFEDLEVVAHTASNGFEAVNLHLNGESYRTIFVVLEMPVRSGITATRTLRGMGVNTPIVGMVREEVDDGDAARAFEEGSLTECHRMPLNADQLKTILRRGIDTDVVLCAYDDHFMVIVTQIGAMGTILHARKEEGVSINPTFNVSVIFGKRDEPMMVACARQLIEHMSNSGASKPLVLSLGLKDHSMETLKGVISAVTQNSLW
ncbi:hypothetical protein SAY86_030580 [Trapa natans]|uniref:Response regulatory domain-containing protein n=1 Tax=Trapa natans TaxID=22666 RepID=A0AAN7M5D2_TRANT|nr:hypothetical protein SAY86_030580 [Trapa natans]